MLLDHVAYRRGRPRAVIDADDVGRQAHRIGGDEGDRDARGQQRQLLGVGDTLGDDHPVDLGRDLLHPLVRARQAGAAQEGDQHRPAEIAQRALDSAQHLLDEQEGLALDIGLGAAALDGDQPDHFLAPLGQALGRAVGDIAERLDGVEHALPGRQADPFLAVDHPRDGGGGDAGRARHVVERGGRRTARPARPVVFHQRLPIPTVSRARPRRTVVVDVGPMARLLR